MAHAEEHAVVVLVRDSNPERFKIVRFECDQGRIVHTSFGLTENDLWAALHKIGLSDDEIKDRLVNAREHPM